ncbi:hypothetical protein RvY_13015 [Ramazzottius varieornatus]|uniref:VASt domain-containing protein n=1 Tax=Ramazzottius varieornatus TaxID=947166 RepID=A0A1D1VLF2_RAMVA|nr:hypothetical protein RvY_13015 [Ramazzottius varieornatus]
MDNKEAPEIQQNTTTPTSLENSTSLPINFSENPQDGNVVDNSKRQFPEQPESLNESSLSSSITSNHDAEELSPAPPVVTSGDITRSTTEQHSSTTSEVTENGRDGAGKEVSDSVSRKSISSSSSSLTEDVTDPLLRRSTSPPSESEKRVSQMEEELTKMKQAASTGSSSSSSQHKDNNTESRSGNTSTTTVDATSSSMSGTGSDTKLDDGKILSSSLNDVHVESGRIEETVITGGAHETAERLRTSSVSTKLPKKKHAPSAPSSAPVGAPLITLSAPLHRHGSDASSISSSTGKSGKGSDKKKHGRWYQSLYPTYKQRSEELKKLFPLLDASERLLVDHSCALQKDILVQGRLYVSQYHICFYAKILAWETTICTPWKTVTALSKERTAKIIPNALSYTTETGEQNYFTSFGQRDKIFTNLYRIWQGALKEQPMTTAEMWSFVHSQYGDELGLTSDDEDYVQPAYLRSYPEEIAGSAQGDSDEGQAGDVAPSTSRKKDKHHSTASESTGATTPTATTPTATTPVEDMENGVKAGTSSVGDDRSESGSDFVAEDDDASDAPLFIPSLEGQMLIDHEFRIPFDRLFLVLFSESTLLKEMFARRKIMDTEFGQWNLDPTTDCQVRDVKYRISLGPKTIRTVERQTLLKESLTGRLHLVDSVAQNHGAPYGDSFSVVTHYLLYKVVSAGAPASSSLKVSTEVVFRKVNWAVKAVLEKSVMDQLRDYMADLKGRLSLYEAELATGGDAVDGLVEDDKTKLSKKRSTAEMPVLSRLTSVASITPFNTRRTQRASTIDASQVNLEDPTDNPVFVTRAEHYRMKRLIYVILILLLVNVVLYWRLWDWFTFGTGETTASTASCTEGAFCPPRTVKAEQWYWLIDKFSQPKNAPLLKNINEGLIHVLNGMHQISTALEELHTSLSFSESEKVLQQ